MKIIHTSDINLGKKFTGLKLSGDKLRAGLKASFARIVDYTINEKADMLIIAGKLFDNLEISNNLQRFVIEELGRLKSIPAVILPECDSETNDDSLWKAWDNQDQHDNIFVLVDSMESFKTFDQLNCTVYRLSRNTDNNKST